MNACVRAGDFAFTKKKKEKKKGWSRSKVKLDL